MHSWMRFALSAAVILYLGLLAEGASGEDKYRAQPAPPGAEVYFHYPIDGLHVPQRFVVRIGLHNMGVAPAGVVKQGTGHHHLLIDANLPALDQPIPSDFNHIHLGNGQTEVVITLPPGTHTLQLVVGDHAHFPHNPPVISKKITVYVR
jgi:hypothetical protein